MNKVILMGRIVKDPELRNNPSQTMAVCRYSLAVTRKYKKDGEPDADFINCIAFGKLAEFSEKYFKKGMMVAISGRLQVRSWEDPQKGRQWSTEVIVDEQEFAESKASFESRNNSNSSFDSDTKKQENSYSIPEGFTAIEEDINEEDLPF